MSPGAICHAMGNESVYQVVVVGGGPAGLAAASLLAQAGVNTACLTGRPSPARPDPRTVALMLPSMRLLKHLGVWPGALQDKAAPLRKLRLVDDTGSLVAADPVTFSAIEIGEDAFGWNIPVALLTEALEQRARAAGAILIPEQAIAAHRVSAQVSVTTRAEQILKAGLVIAADGARSAIRRTIGISTLDWSYEQTAIAASFGHSSPHDGVSIEFHKAAGPLTTVPMPGKRSSLVWMETPDRAETLMSLSNAEFAKQLQRETHGDLGLIDEIGPRRAFPMRGLTASTFAAHRVMLVGEAAHVVPPIGAQGLNMSLRDAALASQLITDAFDFGEDPGIDKVLSDYDTARRRDVLPRQAAIHTLNSSLLAGLAPFHALRAIGLTAISQVAPLRSRIIKEGLAPSSGLPRLMRLT